jgi:hypothetical protein
MKTYFVFDAETCCILSGFDCCDDDQSDGYNLYTRPYKYREFHPKNEKCRMDYIYNMSRRTGLQKLKYNNLKVAVVDNPFAIKSEFVKNPHYFDSKGAICGWWKLIDRNFETV